MKSKSQKKNERRRLITLELLAEKNGVFLIVSVNGLYSHEIIGMLTEALDKIRRREVMNDSLSKGSAMDRLMADLLKRQEGEKK